MSNVMKEMIEQWAFERDLHNADPNKQILKIGEEYGELCEFVTKNRGIEVARDAIGDMYVVLVILCMQLDLDIEECIDGAFVKSEDL